MQIQLLDGFIPDEKRGVVDKDYETVFIKIKKYDLCISEKYRPKD